MLWGYFDESGTDGQLGHTVVSGLISDVANWSRLSSAWKWQLNRDKITTFHCVECQNRQGQYLGWDYNSQCKPHLERLADIISRNAIVGVISAFSGDYQTVSRSAPSYFVKIAPTAYALCLNMMVQKIRRISVENNWGDKRISLIFSRQDQFSSHALDVWNSYKSFGLWPEIAHVGYAEPSCLTQLQAADMLAWETRRFLWKREAGLSRQPLLNRLLKKKYEGAPSFYEASFTEKTLLQKIANGDFAN